MEGAEAVMKENDIFGEPFKIPSFDLAARGGMTKKQHWSSMGLVIGACVISFVVVGSLFQAYTVLDGTWKGMFFQFGIYILIVAPGTWWIRNKVK